MSENNQEIIHEIYSKATSQMKMLKEIDALDRLLRFTAGKECQGSMSITVSSDHLSEGENYEIFTTYPMKVTCPEFRQYLELRMEALTKMVIESAD